MAARRLSVLSVIRPPMTTIKPSGVFTTLSVSFTLLMASGTEGDPAAVDDAFCFSVIEFTRACTCRVTRSRSSICGVTSSEMPEKKGW